MALLQAPEITFPETKSVPAELKTVIDRLLKTELWTAALKSTEEKMGACRTKISIRIVEADDGALAATDTISLEEDGKWRAVETVISINLTAISKLEREVKAAGGAKLRYPFP